jgi:hypothetical protein
VKEAGEKTNMVALVGGIAQVLASLVTIVVVLQR